MDGLGIQVEGSGCKRTTETIGEDGIGFMKVAGELTKRTEKLSLLMSIRRGEEDKSCPEAKGEAQSGWPDL